MSTPPPRSRIPLLVLILICLPASITVTWWARGIFDRHFRSEGRIHLINHSSDAHRVRLEFPSGNAVETELASGGFEDFRVTDTGEGSIALSIDGKLPDRVGYVTSHNSPMIIVVDESRITLSAMGTSSTNKAH